jgi:uncharacterized protein (TIGR02996 family)
MTPLQQALEAALVENPDDVAAHMAYGDYLAEQDDPRGEFVQAQIALEGERVPPSERKRLAARAAELLEAHRDEWLGALAPHFPPGERPLNAVTFRRGWIDAVRVHTLTVELAQALAGAAELRLLRRLTIVSGMNAVEDLGPLSGAKHFGNVTSLSLGDVEGDVGFRTFPYLCSLNGLIRPMPHLAELHLNVVEGDLALAHLDLPPLRVLRLERARLDDLGVGSLATLLPPGLKVLQIWNARFTDVGAQALARAPALKNLDLLDVSFNWLTEAGVAALREACPNVVAEYQMTQAEDVDDEFAGSDEFELTLDSVGQAPDMESSEFELTLDDWLHEDDPPPSPE